MELKIKTPQIRQLPTDVKREMGEEITEQPRLAGKNAQEAAERHRRNCKYIEDRNCKYLPLKIIVLKENR
jgi:hypothetical protein